MAHPAPRPIRRPGTELAWTRPPARPGLRVTGPASARARSSPGGSYPRMRGGCSRERTLTILRQASSPRLRGLLSWPSPHNNRAVVVPAPAGVALPHACSPSLARSRPRACGGCSGEVPDMTALDSSSPRLAGPAGVATVIASSSDAHGPYRAPPAPPHGGSSCPNHRRTGAVRTRIAQEVRLRAPGPGRRLRRWRRRAGRPPRLRPAVRRCGGSAPSGESVPYTRVRHDGTARSPAPPAFRRARRRSAFPLSSRACSWSRASSSARR